MDSTELFSYYPASSDDVRAAAEATRGRVGGVRRVMGEVQDGHRRTLGLVAGVLESSMRDAPRQVVEQSTRVLRTAEYAAGCLEYFGCAIDAYNFDSSEPRSINRLNRAYSTTIANAFGLDPLPDDATDSQVTRWSNRLEREAERLATVLRAEKARLDAQLDGHALEVRQMLARGPNSADLRLLWRHGALPPYAPVLFPGTAFDDLRTPPELQAELVEYLLAHPDELAHPDPAYLALLAGLPAELRERFEIGQRMEQLRRREPRSLYEEWLARAVDRGLSLDEVLAQIESEQVTPESFDVLEGLARIEDPDGRVYYLLDSVCSDRLREVAEAVELLNGGLPSESAWRRDANDWSYEAASHVLSANGALVATPEGILMAMGDDAVSDLLSQRAGTTYGEVFLVDGSPDDPEYELRDRVRYGYLEPYDAECPPPPLQDLLQHERIHTEQWAEYGRWGMVESYAAESVSAPDGFTWSSPHQRLPGLDLFPDEAEPGENALEVEAGLEDGGYGCFDGDDEA